MLKVSSSIFDYFITITSEVYTTLEPPTTLNDDHVVDWYTENFGFQIIESDPEAGLFKVAWNEGLYIDDNNDIQSNSNPVDKVHNGKPYAGRSSKVQVF